MASISSNMTQFEIVEVSGDLFAAPDHSVLIRKASTSSCEPCRRTNLLTILHHPDAVNSFGIWGSGVALAFKQKVKRLRKLHRC